MAYSTPITAVANATFTAAQFNASVRDNILVTPAALATATGRMYISNGVNSIAERVPQIGRITGGGQATASTSFTDVTTVGPTVTAATGTSAIIAISAFCQNSVAGQGCYMGVDVSGATTIAASVDRALRIMSGAAAENSKQSYVGMYFGTLTAGSNTFRAKYASVASGNAQFDERELVLIPL